MSASTLTPLTPRSRLEPLATVITWACWLAVSWSPGTSTGASGPVAWSVDWPVAWTGLGLIIFARIMRTGAGMRADLEGTV